MACAQELQTNFNIQSNIIGIINLEKKKVKSNTLRAASIPPHQFPLDSAPRLAWEEAPRSLLGPEAVGGQYLRLSSVKG